MELSHVPVIVVSARDMEANEGRALDADAVAYIQKPFEDADLLEAISTALGFGTL